MVTSDRDWMGELARAPVAVLERTGAAMCAAAGRNPRRMVQGGVIAAGMALATAPAAAQFCESNPGQLAGFAVNSSLTLVVTAIFLGIIIGAALRSFGLRRIGNVVIGGVGVAVVTLVGGMWLADSALAYVPGASMDAACGGVGGDS